MTGGDTIMNVQVTPEDIVELNKQLLVVRRLPEGGTWIKGRLEDILDYYIPEGSQVVSFEDAKAAPVGVSDGSGRHI